MPFDRAWKALQNRLFLMTWKSGPLDQVLIITTFETWFLTFLTDIRWFSVRIILTSLHINNIFRISTKNWVDLHGFQFISTTFFFGPIFTPTTPQGYAKKLISWKYLLYWSVIRLFVLLYHLWAWRLILTVQMAF